MIKSVHQEPTFICTYMRMCYKLETADELSGSQSARNLNSRGPHIWTHMDKCVL